MVRHGWLLALLLLATIAGSGCSLVAPPPPRALPKRILFIGTSYTYWNEGLEKHLKGMAASATPPRPIDADSVVIGAASLATLLEWPGVQNAIQQGDWDVVVIESDVASGVSGRHESYLKYVRKFDELIRSSGAVSVLFMEWQVNYEGEAGALNSPVEEIAQTVSRAGAENDCKVAPVGLAWARSKAERPELELYDPDRSHPNAAGTYLTTAVFYATIFGRDPQGLPYGLEEVYPESAAYDQFRAELTVPEEDKAFLQRIAWETVQDYAAQQQISQ